MFQVDTLIYDTKKITDYQNDSHFDYLSQINTPDNSWFDLVASLFNRLINAIFSGKFEERVTTPLLIVIFLLILITTLYFLYKKRPELFLRSKKTTPVPYTIEEENIHRIDFDKEIAKSLQNSDYRLSIRLLYLQTLRFFSDNQLIDWQPHKTPMEYLYEIKNTEIRQPFRVFTNHFLHVRYGNYPASLELYEAMFAIQKSIKQIEKGASE